MNCNDQPVAFMANIEDHKAINIVRIGKTGT